MLRACACGVNLFAAMYAVLDSRCGVQLYGIL